MVTEKLPELVTKKFIVTTKLVAKKFIVTTKLLLVAKKFIVTTKLLLVAKKFIVTAKLDTKKLALLRRQKLFSYYEVSRSEG